MSRKADALSEILRQRLQAPSSERGAVAARITNDDESTRFSVAGLELAAVDWCDRDLSGLDLTGCQLRGAQLVGSGLDGASFVLADLRGATVEKSTARGADFRGADLRAANLDELDAAGADFREADVRIMRAMNARFVGARFDGALMPRLGLFEYPMVEGPFADADLECAWFDLVTIERSAWDAKDVAAAAAFGMRWTEPEDGPPPPELWRAYAGDAAPPPTFADDNDEPF